MCDLLSPEKFLRASEHTRKIKFEMYNYMYYQVLMITKMSKPEISGKILKRKEVIIRITQKLINRHPGYGLSFKPNMKQICESVKDLETDTGFWRPSWFL